MSYIFKPLDDWDPNKEPNSKPKSNTPWWGELIENSLKWTVIAMSIVTFAAVCAKTPAEFL